MLRCKLIPLCFIFFLLQFQLTLKSEAGSGKAVRPAFEADTAKANSLLIIGSQFSNSNPDTALIILTDALTISKKNGYKTGIVKSLIAIGSVETNTGAYDSALENLQNALKIDEEILNNVREGPDRETALKLKGKALNNIGRIYMYKGDLNQSAEFLKRAIYLRLKINDKTGLASSFANLANIYVIQGNYPESLNYFFATLKIYESQNDKAGIASTYNNIGNIYQYMKKNKQALKYYLVSSKLKKETGDINSLASTYTNIANIHLKEERPDQAMTYFNSSLKLYENASDKKGIAVTYLNLAMVFESKGNYDKALEYYSNSNKLFEEMGEKNSSIKYYSGIGYVYMHQKKYTEARKNLLKGITLAREIGSLSDIKEGYEFLSRLDSIEGNYAGALKNYKYFVKARDSLYGVENSEKILAAQLKYEFDKKNELSQAVQEKKDEIARKDIQNQKLQRNVFVAGLALVIVFSVWLLSVNRARRKVNNTLSEKKIELEGKNNEILQSINYAKRIQEAILPDKKMFDSIGGSFIFYQPKDIVSGDFYWFLQKSGYVFAAVADCTGHGVPGAFMSIVGHNGLNRIVAELGISEPEEILQQLNHYVNESLKKQDDNPIGDGMDIALIRFDPQNSELRYSGANRPLYHLRGTNITEYKPDKSGIGNSGFLHPSFQGFTSKILTLEKGDRFYLFTDGIPDQFNADGKKLLSKRLKEFLILTSSQTITQQEIELTRYFNDWKQNAEQTDDVLMMGFSV